MIKVYEYLGISEFLDKFIGLDNTSWADEYEALGVLYDYLEEIEEETFYKLSISDWLRFEVMEMTADDIEKNYDVDFKRFPGTEDFLNYYTALYGTYEADGVTYYLFGEF